MTCYKNHWLGFFEKEIFAVRYQRPQAMSSKHWLLASTRIFLTGQQNDKFKKRILIDFFFFQILEICTEPQTTIHVLGL